MSIEVRLVAESPFTVDTLVGLLACMTSQMDFQMFFYCKRSWAFCTLEWLFARMRSYMPREVNSMREFPRAMNALIGFLARMDPRMFRERTF